MGYGHRARPAFGERGFGGVIGGIEVDVRHLANQPVRPVARAKPCLLAGHELQCAMHAEMQDGIRFQRVLEPEIECGEGMRRGEAFLEQKPHRVTFVAEGGLHADKDFAEMCAEHKYPASVRLDTPRCRAPDGFDGSQRRRGFDDRIGTHMIGDIRFLTVLARVAVQHRVAQIFDVRGQVDIVSVSLKTF